MFGRFKLVKILGRGGMGIVWLARDEELERDVALKFLPDLMIQDRALFDQLKREAKRCLGLTHPDIVRIQHRLGDAFAVFNNSDSANVAWSIRDFRVIRGRPQLSA